MSTVSSTTSNPSQRFTWIHLAKNPRHHIVYPDLESADDLLVATNAFNVHKNEATQHALDHTWAHYLKSFFASAWFDDAVAARKEDNLDTVTTRILGLNNPEDCLGPTTPIKAHLAGATRRLAATTKAAWQLAQLFKKERDTHLIAIKETKNLLENEQNLLARIRLLEIENQTYKEDNSNSDRKIRHALSVLPDVNNVLELETAVQILQVEHRNASNFANAL